MSTISENLLALQQTKENFKTAFAEKGVDVSNTPFTEYPNKFGEIQTGGGTGGDYFVKVIDYDGTILKEARLDTGDTFTLPNAPSHDGLVFQEWRCSQEIVDGVITIEDNNVMVGAVYSNALQETESGMSEFDIELNKVIAPDIETNGFVFTLNMDGTKDWGDGTSDDLTTHTYTSYGKYTIKCNGTTMTTNSNSGLFGQGLNTKIYYCRNVRLMNITTISDSAFQYCQIENITIPNSVTKIGKSALQSCGLTSLIIPNSVIDIQPYAFRSNTSLKSVILPKSLTYFYGYAFDSCTSLTNAILPNNVTTIGEKLFNKCTSLINVLIPNGFKKLGANMFTECSLLKEVVLPNSITTIDTSVFSSCTLLKSIKIPNSATTISGYMFSGCGSITDVTLPNNITGIPTYMFNGCTRLTNIIIPNSVTNINTYAFQSCGSLTNIVIPNNVTTIQSYAFSGCGNLRSVVFGSGVTSLYGSAFNSCAKVKTYDFSNHTSVPTLGTTSAITVNPFTKIIVPDNLYDAWIVATNWATYADYIYKASEVL